MERKDAVFRRSKHELGIQNENGYQSLIETALEQKRVPRWFTGIEKADPVDDRHGIDFWIITDMGRFPIQVKSSRAGKKQAIKKHPKIPVVVVNPGKIESKIINTTIHVIGEKRNKLKRSLDES